MSNLPQPQHKPKEGEPVVQQKTALPEAQDKTLEGVSPASLKTPQKGITVHYSPARILAVWNRTQKNLCQDQLRKIDFYRGSPEGFEHWWTESGFGLSYGSLENAQLNIANTMRDVFEGKKKVRIVSSVEQTRHLRYVEVLSGLLTNSERTPWYLNHAAKMVEAIGASQSFSSDEKRYLAETSLDLIELLKSQGGVRDETAYDSMRLAACRIMVGEPLKEWIQYFYTSSPDLNDGRREKFLEDCKRRVDSLTLSGLRPLVDELRRVTPFGESFSEDEGRDYAKKVLGHEPPKTVEGVFYLPYLDASEKKAFAGFERGIGQASDVTAVQYGAFASAENVSIQDPSMRKKLILVHDREEYFRVKKRMNACLEKNDVEGVVGIFREMEDNYKKGFYHQRRDGENFMGELDANLEFMQDAFTTLQEKGLQVPVDVQLSFYVFKAFVKRLARLSEEGCRTSKDYFVKRCTKIPGANERVVAGLVKGFEKISSSDYELEETLAIASQVKDETLQRIVERAIRLDEVGAAQMIPEVAVKAYHFEIQRDVRETLLHAGKPLEMFWTSPEVVEYFPMRERIDRVVGTLDEVNQRLALYLIMSAREKEYTNLLLNGLENPEMLGYPAGEGRLVVRTHADAGIPQEVMHLIDTLPYDGARALYDARKGSKENVGLFRALIGLACDMNPRVRLPCEEELMIFRDILEMGIAHPDDQELLVLKALKPFIKVARHYERLCREYARIDPNSPAFSGDLTLLHAGAGEMHGMMRELNSENPAGEQLRFFTASEIQDSHDAMTRIAEGQSKLTPDEAQIVLNHFKTIGRMFESSNDLFIELPVQTIQLLYPDDSKPVIGEGNVTLAREFLKGFMEKPFYPRWDVKDDRQKG